MIGRLGAAEPLAGQGFTVYLMPRRDYLVAEFLWRKRPDFRSRDRRRNYYQLNQLTR